MTLMKTMAAGASIVTLLGLIAPTKAFELPKVGLPSLFGGEAKDGAPLPPGATANCPHTYLDPGASMIRVPAEADSANVRYQLSIRATARECVISDNTLSIKVGIEGAAMLGPLGQPGAFGGNIRVALRDVKKDVIVQSKTVRVGASVPSGANRGEFQTIVDPFVVPMQSMNAQDDFDILIGFTQGGADRAENPTPRKGGARKRRRG